MIGTEIFIFFLIKSDKFGIEVYKNSIHHSLIILLIYDYYIFILFEKKWALIYSIK